MGSFKVSVGDKEYEIEFTRDSVRQFESMGGNIQDMQGKIYTTTDLLFYAGLIKHHPEVNPNLAKKISDAAIEEYGIDTVYAPLVEAFMEVFTSAGEKPAGKSFLVAKTKKA